MPKAIGVYFITRFVLRHDVRTWCTNKLLSLLCPVLGCVNKSRWARLEACTDGCSLALLVRRLLIDPASLPNIVRTPVPFVFYNTIRDDTYSTLAFGRPVPTIEVVMFVS